MRETSSSDDDGNDSLYVSSKPIKKKNVNIGEKDAMIIKLIDAAPAVRRLTKTVVGCKSLANSIK